MTGPSASLPEPRELDGLAPLIGRIAQASPTAQVRVRATPTVISLFSREPFDVLISRSVGRVGGSGQDYTCTAAGLRAWIENAPQPADLGAAWRGSLPPTSGWQLIDPIPADVIDTITSNGAKILHDLRGEVDADLRSAAALDSVVLTVKSGDGQQPAELNLRLITAVQRLGFVAAGSSAQVLVSGSWAALSCTNGVGYLSRSVAKSGSTGPVGLLQLL